MRNQVLVSTWSTLSQLAHPSRLALGTAQSQSLTSQPESEPEHPVRTGRTRDAHVRVRASL